MRGWTGMPCWANGTRFDSVDLMIEENLLTRDRALACFALGETDYTEKDGYTVEFRLDDDDMESDRVRRAAPFTWTGWRKAGLAGKAPRHK